MFFYRQCLWLLDLAVLFSIELSSAYGLSGILESPSKFFSLELLSVTFRRRSVAS
ncbi:unnamed protein product [Brassica rapa]|uniref:Uncharacterized protein n=1 Tax=Brassica campestris TaxID=3711 RepID=A0A3P5Z1F3_BRACM|nr:unnamed protein product [Brassica rapa]VDC67753.1 unnamed protein product [Brassica rapa]